MLACDAMTRVRGEGEGQGEGEREKGNNSLAAILSGKSTQETGVGIVEVGKRDRARDGEARSWTGWWCGKLDTRRRAGETGQWWSLRLLEGHVFFVIKAPGWRGKAAFKA